MSPMTGEEGRSAGTEEGLEKEDREDGVVARPWRKEARGSSSRRHRQQDVFSTDTGGGLHEWPAQATQLLVALTQLFSVRALWLLIINGNRNF